MKKSLTTEQRVAKILEGMRKAMPEIKRQVAVYEKSLQHSTGAKSAPLTIHSRNV
jgi:hypothetical protein